MIAVVLMAGDGTRLGSDRTKAMIEFGGKPLIDYTLDSLCKAGIRKAYLVIGYKSEMVIDHCKDSFKLVDVKYVLNNNYSITGTTESLRLASKYFKNQDTVFIEGDTLLHPKLVLDVVNSSGNILLVDTEFGNDVLVYGDSSRAVGLSWNYGSKNLAMGSMIMIWKTKKETSKTFANLLDKSDSFEDIDPLDKLLKYHLFNYIHTEDYPWIEIDTSKDLSRAKKVFKRMYD